MRSRVYETAHVRLSVRSIIRPPLAAAAGLLLSAVSAGDIDRQRLSSKCEQCRVYDTIRYEMLF